MEALRVLHPRHGVHAPTTSTPARAPGSLRRTATTDALRPDGMLGDVVLAGRARDLWTGVRGEAHVVAESGTDARVDFRANRAVRMIATRPARAAAGKLVGARASSGFRAALDAALPDERDAGSLLYLLLDDLPVATLVSGYALGAAGVHPPAGTKLVHQHPDLCAGWRTGGTMLVELDESGHVPVATGPEAPSLARAGDPLAWHALPPLPPHAMRRHRRLDVTVGDAIAVDVFFRDSHMSADGRETVVHEYTVTARIDRATRAIEAIEATARALPWVECNPAAASAADLLGCPVRDLRTRVRKELTGPRTCTHLNDTLRSLADVETLVARVERLRSAEA